MTLKWKRAAKTEETNEQKYSDFIWFIERIQMRMAFGLLSERSGEKTSSLRTF